MADITSIVQDTAEIDPLQIRRMQAKLEASNLRQLPPLSPDLCERTTVIPLSPSYSADVKLIYPSSNLSAPRPLVVLFYGGGFRAGSCHQLTEPGRTFAEKFNAVVVLGSYRMVPEVKWPVPWKDGWDLLAFLSRHACKPEWGGAELAIEKGGGFIVGGLSAGASIAVVCAGLDAFGSAVQEGLQELAARLTGVMANVPFMLVPETVPPEQTAHWTAWQDNEDVEGFNTNSLKAVMKGIQCTDYTSRWFSPIPDLLSSHGRLKRHPKVYVSVCQMDPLRDDGRVYCDLLRQKGVEVKMDLFPDDGHTGWTIVPRQWKSMEPTIPEAYIEAIKWLL